MATYCEESEILRKLCMSCPYDNCTSADRGCAEYRKAEACEKAGKPYSMPDDWKPGARSKEAAETCLDAAFKKLKKRPPAIMIEPAPQQPAAAPAPPSTALNTLPLYNAAIKALRALWAAESSAEGLSAVPITITQLARARAERFESLIDWDAIEQKLGGTT